MKNIFIFLGIIVFVVSSCKSREEKANELIKAELFKTLYDFSSYEPIETIIDSAFTSIYTDSTILTHAYIIKGCIDRLDKYISEINSARSSMDIWGDSYSSYSRRKYNDALEKFETNLEKAKTVMKKMNESMLFIKGRIDKFETSHIGFQAKHKFRCKSKGGNFTIGNYLYIIDEKFEKIISVIDLDDDDNEEMKKIIDEAKEFEVTDE
jgi:hypothetical protein